MAKASSALLKYQLRSNGETWDLWITAANKPVKTFATWAEAAAFLSALKTELPFPYLTEDDEPSTESTLLEYFQNRQAARDRNQRIYNVSDT